MKPRTRISRAVLAAAIVASLGGAPASATAQPAASMSVVDAVRAAQQAHPAVRAARARSDAAAGSIELARLTYQPRTDLHVQEVRATRNNISGLVLPQPVLPQISGPVLDDTSGRARWNSAIGGLVAWEPFDFGWRRARTELATAETRQVATSVDTTALDVSTAAAEAFLAALAAAESERVARSNVERMETFARTVHALAKSELRPGADAARADAELARARTQLAQAEQGLEVARIALAEAAGLETPPTTLLGGRLLTAAPGSASPSTSSSPADHPQVRSQAAAVDTVRARQRVIETSAMPKIQLVGALASRGSGFAPDGALETDAGRGLLPNVGNWAVGASVSYALHERAERRVRRRIEGDNERAERARLDAVSLAISSQQRQAKALLRGARRVAEQVGVQLSSARDAQSQARSRFDQGLASVTEVAEADLLLARAEADDVVARIGVWRGLLAVARTSGAIDGWLALAAGEPSPREGR